MFSQAVITEDAYPPGEHVHQAHFYWGQMHILLSKSPQKFILGSFGLHEMNSWVNIFKGFFKAKMSQLRFLGGKKVIKSYLF